MADINSAANGGPVLSYTVTNDRGWNDPPSFAFSPNTGNRKRIDPRKRVAHNISSVGNGFPVPTQSPTFQPIQRQPPQTEQYQPSIQPQPNIMMNGMTQMFNNMSVSSPPPPMNHASSNPDLHQMPFLHPLHHSTSVPNQMNKTGQNRIPGHSLGTMTPPPSGTNTPPVQTRSGSATPPYRPSHSPNRKSSVPSLPYASSIFDQHSTPTMLQSSHLSSSSSPSPIKPQENGIYRANPYTDQNHQTANTYGMINDHQKMPPTIYSPPPSQQVPNHLCSPTTSGQNSFSPTASIADPFQQGMFGLPNSNPTTMLRKTSPTNVPPPVAGYYARRVSNGYNSPKASPVHSGQSSPIPSMDLTLLENDKEVLEHTLKKLNDCREQCMCRMTSKASEDINKKIKVFESAWVSGKLSTLTKRKMVQLADALSKKDYMLADRLHKSLLHEHSNEVSSWLVGIKKLLSCCQEEHVAPSQ